MTLKLTKGALIIYRLFDIAEEIDLSMLESLLKAGNERLHLAAKSRDAVVMRDAPIRLTLVDAEMPLGKNGDRSELPLGAPQAYATLWNYGTLSIAWHFPFQRSLDWNGLMQLSSLIHWNVDLVAQIDRASERKAKEISQMILPALKTPALWSVSEDYAIFFAENLEGLDTEKPLSQQIPLAPLLAGEVQETLSLSYSQSLLDSTFQYSNRDLVAIDWDSSFVYEPSGSKEIPDIIEFALTHLLELRYYDDLIDRRLNRLYDSIEESRRHYLKKSALALVEEANTRFMEFSEIMERMGNSLKVVGDFYLARIFRASVRRFRVKDWEETITRKINLLARVSEILQGESNVRRSHLLEIIIILLIAFEVVGSLLKAF